VAQSQAAAGPAAPHHFAAYHQYTPVYYVTADGSVAMAGSVSAANGTFSVGVDGAVAMGALGVAGSARVGGDAAVAGGLAVGAGYRLHPHGMVIAPPAADTPASALLTIAGGTAGADAAAEAAGGAFAGTLLSLQAPSPVGSNGAAATMLKASVGGVTTFELTADGHMHTKVRLGREQQDTARLCATQLLIFCLCRTLFPSPLSLSPTRC